MRQKLSKAMLDAARPRKKRYLLLDTRTLGLALKVEPSGRKAFVFEYRMAGRNSRRCIIGRYGEPWTLDMARKEAGRLRALVDQGTDPLEEQQKAEQEVHAAHTVADLMEATFAHMETIGRKAASIYEYRRMFRKDIAGPFGNRRVDSITSADIAQLHRRMAKTPYTANRVLGLLKRAFSLAQRWGFRQPGNNPAQFIERYKEYRRGDKKGAMLSAEQISRLLAAIATEEKLGASPFAIAAIRLGFWTGWRLRSEVLRLRWEDIDFETGLTRLLGTKTAEEEYRTLPDEALEILRRLPRIEGSPWVFPGRYPSRPRSSVRLTWKPIRNRAGLVGLDDLGNYRIHDLRHNAVSWDVSRGVSLKIAGASVGHKSQRSTEIYAHFLPNHLREATNARARAMKEAARGQGPS